MACVYSLDPPPQALINGLVDVGLATSYRPTLLAKRDGRGSILITATEAKLFDQSGKLIGQVSSDANIAFDASDSGSSNYALVPATLMDSAEIATLAPLTSGANQYLTVHAQISFRIRSPDGELVQSEIYDFPIDLCLGCLVGVPSDAVDVSKPQPNCDVPLRPMENPVRPCVIGQEQLIDCRVCEQFPVCRPNP